MSRLVNNTQIHLPKCQHGFAADDDRYDGVWATPFSKCECCGIDFPYIDSMTIFGNKSFYKTWTKYLCSECGGYYIEYGESVVNK